MEGGEKKDEGGLSCWGSPGRIGRRKKMGMKGGGRPSAMCGNSRKCEAVQHKRRKRSWEAATEDDVGKGLPLLAFRGAKPVGGVKGVNKGGCLGARDFAKECPRSIGAGRGGESVGRSRHMIGGSRF